MGFNRNLGNIPQVITELNGNIGIGTTSPSEKLQVIGNISAAGNIQTDGTANRYVKSTGFISNQLGQLSDFGGNDAGYYFVSGGGIQFVSGGANRLLLNSSGNVGIGTTSPSYKLDVLGDIGAYANGDNNGFIGTSGGTHLISLTRLSNNAKLSGFDGVVFYTNATTLAGGSERMRITSGGQVLIGTQTDNGAKLQVNGDVTANTFYANAAPGNPSVDSSGRFINLANGAYIDFPSMSGMIIVNNTGTGAIQAFLCGGGNTASLGFATGTTGSMAHSPSVGGYRFTNNTGSAWVFSFQVLKTRGTA